VSVVVLTERTSLGAGGEERLMIGELLRRWYPCLTLLAALVAPVANCLADERRPNFVLIVADDLGWGDVGFNGRTEWATPNLDRLVREGVILKRCYSAATVCAPSRAAFLTGKYTIHSGVRRNDQDLPVEEVTIAEALKPLGYATALFGKWHQGRPRDGHSQPVHPMDHGFEEFVGYRDAIKGWEKFPKSLWDGRHEVPVAGYFDDLITDRALDFMKRRRERPFFLYLAYVSSHFNIAAPRDEIDKLTGTVLQADHKPTLNATYAAMITRLDRNIGRLAAGLDELGLAANTLIVFTGDNGATFESGNQGVSAALDSNRPLRGQKRTLWEGGIRVPGLVRWPGQIPAGSTCSLAVHLIDLLPSVLAAAGGSVDPSWHVDGTNMLPVWTGKASASGRTLFWEWQSEGYDQLAAMRGDLKLVVTRGGKPELFNVAADPAERLDISAIEPETTRRLNEELTAWLKTEVHRGTDK
jgi:arylsulfatase A-like enzyme